MNWFIVAVVVIASFVTTSVCENPPNLDKECLVPPPNDVDPESCCNMPDVLDPAVVESCEHKVFGPASNAQANNSNEPPFAPQVRCITECILNETGILKDRVFMPNVAADLAKKLLGPKHAWLPVIEDALKICNEHATKSKFDDKKACGHMGAFLVACLNTQMFKNCPESAWTDAKGCAALRQTTIKCPIIAPIPLQD